MTIKRIRRIENIKIKPFMGSNGLWGTEVTYLLNGRSNCARINEPISTEAARIWLINIKE